MEACGEACTEFCVDRTHHQNPRGFRRAVVGEGEGSAVCIFAAADVCAIFGEASVGALWMRGWRRQGQVEMEHGP